MTVGELKLMLADAPDDMEVLIPASECFDGFFFTPCGEDSGVADLGVNEIGDTEPSFMLVPCGFWEIEEENETGFYPELN